MKIKHIILGALLFGSFAACEQMEDNYAGYLEEEKIYSPRVTDLSAREGLREATLYWTNPSGDIARQIRVDYGDSAFTTESMVDSMLLTGLEIKGYDVSVFTLDRFGNLSVPATIQIFPNGEE